MATEAESNKYKQSATYKLFEVSYNLRALETWVVNEKAYNLIKQAIVAVNQLDSIDFAEDRNGNVIDELLPFSKPDWKD